MPWHSREHLRPLLGSAVLHLLFVAVVLVAAVRWRSEPSSTPLAIEGNIVRYEDLPPSVRAGKPLPEPAEELPVAMPQPKPEPEPEPEPKPADPQPEPQPAPQPEPVETPAEDLRQAQEAAAALERQQAAEKRAAAELLAQQRAETEARRKAGEEARRKADEEARRKAEAAANAQAELAAREQQEKEAAARAAKQKSAREAELRRVLALEEEGEAVAQSGVMNEYIALLQQTIERNWIRPPSAKAGLKCTLYVTQATGGTVIEVTIGECNGDQAVRESVTNAVYRSSPLPAPRDPRAFDRRLVIVFTPKE
jgi:colicin import membrane protein